MKPVRSLAVVAALVATTLVPGAGPASAAPGSCATAGLSVTALHGPHFYIDTSSTPNLRGAYAGYRVTDTSGAARDDVWVQLTDFTGGSVALGPGQAAAQQIAALPAGGSAARFSYLTASAASATAQNHTVWVWQGRPDLPGSVQLCAGAGGFSSVDETIKAAANKLTSVSVSGTAPKLGSTFTVTVAGQTGTIGAGTADDPSSFWMSPAALPTWPAGAYRLVGTSLTLDGVGTFTDTLRVSGLASASRTYTAVYTFRAIGFTSSDTAVVPVQQIASGTQIKHTDTSGITLPPIRPATNDLTVAQTVSPSKLPTTGGRADYQLTLQGTAGAVLDSFVASVPGGTQLVPGSVSWHSGQRPDAVASGGTLVFGGPFEVAGQDDVLRFSLELPATSGNAVTKTFGLVGSAQIDTTLALDDDAPARSSVNVNTVPVPVADTVDAAPGAPVVVPVLANDLDADGDPLTVTAAGPAGHGVVTLEDGVVTYTADGEYLGDDSFGYTVSDGRGAQAQAVVDVHVVTELPAEAPSSTTTTEEPEPTTTTITTTTTTTSTVEPESTTTTSTVEPESTTTTTVEPEPTTTTTTVEPEPTTTTTTDEPEPTTTTSTTTSTTTTTTVPPVPLIAAGDSVTVPAGGWTEPELLGNDSGAGDLRVSGAGPAGHGKVTLSGSGVVRYTPAADHHGPDSFTYTVRDGLGRTASATVTVTVSPAPAGVADAASVGWSGTTQLDVLANDPGGAVLQAVTGQPAYGSASIHGDRLTYTASGTFAGTTSLRYRLRGAATDTVVWLTVTAPALTARPDQATGARPGAAVVLNLLGNDTGHGLTVTAVTAPAHGEVTWQPGGKLTYTPPRGLKGQQTFRYTVHDVVGTTASAAVTVTVPNAPPTLAALARVRLVAGRSAVVRLTAADLNADALQVLTGKPAGTAGARDGVRLRVLAGRRLEVRATSGFSGKATVAVSVRDTGGATATRTLSVGVVPAPAAGLRARLLRDPKAEAALRNHTLVNGRPVSRTLSSRVDSRVEWTASPTRSVSSYRVYLGGKRVCTVPAGHDRTPSCDLAGRALQPGDRVTVVAVGGAGLTSAEARVPVLDPGSVSHLLAVVYFPTSEFAIDERSAKVLARVAAQARAAGFSRTLVVGHTDSDGSDRSNRTLSQRRAASVAAYLTGRFDELQPHASGKGETDPLKPNTSRVNKSVNRRVEIYIG